MTPRNAPDAPCNRSDARRSEGPGPSRDRIDAESFLERVNRLARRPGDRDAFHRTRPPFTRLTDVAGRVRAGKEARHPTQCQKDGCGASLAEGYHRRADGLTLCRACYRAEEAGEGVSRREP